MYLTKCIDTEATFELTFEKMDKEFNEMYEKGYELVTYYFHRYSEKVIMTFKKRENGDK